MPERMKEKIPVMMVFTCGNRHIFAIKQTDYQNATTDDGYPKVKCPLCKADVYNNLQIGSFVSGKYVKVH